MKHTYKLIACVALATSFHIHSEEMKIALETTKPGNPPTKNTTAETNAINAQKAQAASAKLAATKASTDGHATQSIFPNRKISVKNNIVTAQEGNVAITFNQSPDTTEPNVFKGKITGMTISKKTSSSTIAANISKQLTKPLTISEQSLLAQAFDIARAPGGNWDHVNKVLDTILYQSNRTEENLTEHNLLDALKNAEKTGTFTDIYNKIMSACGSLFTSGPIPQVGVLGKVHYLNGKLRPTYTLWETLTLPNPTGPRNYTQIPYEDDIKQKTKVITFSDPTITSVTTEKKPQPSLPNQDSGFQAIATEAPYQNNASQEIFASEKTDPKTAFAPTKIRASTAKKITRKRSTSEDPQPISNPNANKPTNHNDGFISINADEDPK